MFDDDWSLDPWLAGIERNRPWQPLRMAAAAAFFGSAVQVLFGAGAAGLGGMFWFALPLSVFFSSLLGPGAIVAGLFGVGLGVAAAVSTRHPECRAKLITRLLSMAVVGFSGALTAWMLLDFDGATGYLLRATS